MAEATTKTVLFIASDFSLRKANELTGRSFKLNTVLADNIPEALRIKDLQADLVIVWECPRDNPKLAEELEELKKLNCPIRLSICICSRGFLRSLKFQVPEGITTFDSMADDEIRKELKRLRDSG